MVTRFDTMNRTVILAYLSLIVATSYASAGEQRASVIINAPTPVAHVYARRSTTSKNLASLKSCQLLSLMTDCRDRKGTRIADRWGPEFGKSGGNPKAIHGLWCEVGFRKTANGPLIWGWLSGKHLKVLPAP
jgi:hypothetical protein